MKTLLLLFSATLVMAQSITPNQPSIKTPFDSYNVSIDFCPLLTACTDSLSVISVTSTNATNGTNSTTTMISSSPGPQVSGTAAVFRLQGGNPGDTHTVLVRIQDATTGEKFQANLTVLVQASR